MVKPENDSKNASVTDKEGFSNKSIDVSRLSSGIYFIQVIIEDKTVIKKFVKE